MGDRFFEGDTVIATHPFDGNEDIVGIIGTVIGCDSYEQYSVEFEEPVCGHDLEGRCEKGYGWHVSRECLEPYVPEIIIPETLSIPYEEAMS